jgi:hypothetical protein
LFQKRIYSIFRGTLVGKRKQTIFKKRWFDITITGSSHSSYSRDFIHSRDSWDAKQ